MTWTYRRSRTIALGAVSGFVLISAVALVIGGCGGGTELPPPDVTTYQTIAIAPLLTPNAHLGMLTARDLGNQIEIALKRVNEDVSVVFDESGDLQPITDALTDLNLTLDAVYADTKLASKVAEALGADILVVARATKANLRTKADDRPVYDMSQQAGISGTTKYTILWQWASSKVAVKVVSAAGDVVWQSGTTPPDEPGETSAYLRYARAYQSQVPEKPAVESKVILTHMRNHTWRLMAHMLYPARFPEVKVPEWREKPTNVFKASGGIVRFD